MKLRRIIPLIFSVFLFLLTCKNRQAVEWIQSTVTKEWTVRPSISLIPSTDTSFDVNVLLFEKQQSVDGFGACFNELGWTALSVLDEKGRQSILKDIFDPAEGLKLSICRMPIGANDYARSWYSLDDSVGDFDLSYFNIDRDRQTLIPYIKAAMKYQPNLKVWGSPWCPPAWMKTNDHYACRADVVNDLEPAGEGHEGKTQFRMESAYLGTYAQYFVKYIKSYREEGIKLFGIHVQNEMNSCQNFPSCIWTAKDLGTFIGSYLGPALDSAFSDVELWYGTIERPWVEKIDTVMQDPVTAKYIDGVGFQWAGKLAISSVHLKYPVLKLMQTETECGDGSNDWKAAEYTFSLMKHYFENGISIYTFWNSILDETGKSQWGWKQNSLISVNSKSNAVTYNPEFYLLKHFSYFIQPGARKLKTDGRDEKLLAFLNPDNSLVLVAANDQDSIQSLRIHLSKKMLLVELEPHSFNTFVLPHEL
jgi:glucosylceramidase